MRRVEEFYCEGGCRRYFKTYLRENMYGNYTIECPACKHHHFRVITHGLITNIRHDEKYGTAEIVMGLMNTIQDTPYHNDPEYRRKDFEVFRGGTQNDNSNVESKPDPVRVGSPQS